MAAGRKMALVPIDMLQRMKSSLTPLTNPNKEQVVKKMEEVKSLIDEEHMPESLKASRMNEKVKNYSVFADKLIAPAKAAAAAATVTKDDDNGMLYNSLPKTFREPAKSLMDELKKHSDKIKWNPITNEVTVHGKVMKGSNILDLVGDVLRTRKSAVTPMHSNAFLKILADLNIPEGFVKNKYRISKFRSYKQNHDGDSDDDDDDISFRRLQVTKARKRLAESGTHRFDGSKRYLTPKKKHRWMKV